MPAPHRFDIGAHVYPLLKTTRHSDRMIKPDPTGRSAKDLARRKATYDAGILAEARTRAAIEADGWTVLAQRLRTAAGEIDMVAEKDGLLAVIEVKSRPTLSQAASALTPRQRHRLTEACEILLLQNPAWGRNGVRFDLIVTDRAGRVRRIADAFRVGDPIW